MTMHTVIIITMLYIPGKYGKNSQVHNFTWQRIVSFLMIVYDGQYASPLMD